MPTVSDSSPARFDFQLDGAQEIRASRLHRESIVVDLLSQHAGGNIFPFYPPALQAEFDARMAEVTAREGEMQALAEATYWPYELSRRGESHLIRDWFHDGGLTCGTYGIEVHDGHDPVCNKWNALTAEYSDLPWLKYVTTAAEVREAKKNGIVAFYAHAQPVYPIPRDLGVIDMAYGKGLRSLMLTYNRMDNIGVGCTERVDAGLSMFGVEVVRHCNDLGLIVDVSHCGHLTTMDACRQSKRPVNANHTAAKGVYEHARCKSDEALRAIADTGGIIGIVAMPFFLSGEPVASIECMLDHIDHVAGLVGPAHVGIGTDWPMQAPDSIVRAALADASLGFRSRDRVDAAQRLRGFDDCRDLPNITRGLIKRGYSDDEIRGILGENALRVFEEVCG